MGIWSIKRVAETIRNMGILEEREINNLATWIWEEGMAIPQSREINLTGEEEKRIHELLDRISNREPVQYVVGHAWFYGIKLKATPDVLIPRPETEELVHWVISDWKSTSKPLRILDIGTGSGCIAITIKKHLDDSAFVTAIDISTKALIVAKENAESSYVNIEFIEHDFLNKGLEGLGTFDIIVSNPPYISRAGVPESIIKDLVHEPDIALYPARDNPDIFYETMSQQLKQHLRPDGFAYLEINEYRASEVRKIFEALDWKFIEMKNDMQGLPRMLKIGFPPGNKE